MIVGQLRLQKVRVGVVWTFSCPRHDMAEGHREFTLSVCVCVCVYVSMCIPESGPGHNLAIHYGI